MTGIISDIISDLTSKKSIKVYTLNCVLIKLTAKFSTSSSDRSKFSKLNVDYLLMNIDFSPRIAVGQYCLARDFLSLLFI